MKPFRKSYWRDPSFIVDDPVIKATGHGKVRDPEFNDSVQFNYLHLFNTVCRTLCFAVRGSLNQGVFCKTISKDDALQGALGNCFAIAAFGTWAGVKVIVLRRVLRIRTFWHIHCMGNSVCND